MDGILVRFRFSNFTSCEFSRSSRFRFCSRAAGCGAVLSSEAEARRAVGLQHGVVAEISGRDPGQCAFSKIAQELAADTPTYLACVGGAGSGTALLCHSNKT